ncbi:hypothetical protein JCM5353_004472 [Sporobolomyces roseus]
MAWAELDPTCFAGTFARYCANPSRVNECCGVCPVVPISYPGTVIAFAVGSFFNLFFALVFRTEAPYNLLCIPVAIAIALCRLEDLHVLSPAASASLRAERRRVNQAFPRGDNASHNQRLEKSSNSIRTDVTAQIENEILPHRKLPRRILWFYFVHMVFFTVVFGLVYLGVKNTHQENCNDKYDLNTFWRPLMGGFAALNLVIGWLGWYILYQNISEYYNPNSKHHRVTAFSGVLWILDVTRNEARSGKASVGYGREELIRCSIALSSFVLWCGPYVTIWWKAAHDFNVLGPNPWVFEQVGAATVSEV